MLKDSLGFTGRQRCDLLSKLPNAAFPQCWSPTLRRRTARKKILGHSTLTRSSSADFATTGQFRRNNKSIFQPKSKTHNILVLGAKNVGKSALTVRYLTKRFIGEYMSGEDQTYDHVALNVKHQPSVIFLDTSHDLDEDKPTDEVVLDEEKVCWADGIIVVYDVSDNSSFDYAHRVISLLKNMQGNRNSDGELSPLRTPKGRLSLDGLIKRPPQNPTMKPTLLIGNKTDLVRRRCVSESEARTSTPRLASWVHYHELSAAEGYEEVFQSVDGLITKIHKMKKST